MLRPDLDWVSCPICDAGSPAGISTCPRCRYQFRIPAGRRAPEFKPSPPTGGPPAERRGRGQLTLGMASLIVAASAVVFAWPALIFPACAAMLASALKRAGLSFVATLAVMVIIGVVLGLLLPPVVTHRGRSLTPPNLAPRRTRPATTVSGIIERRSGGPIL